MPAYAAYDRNRITFFDESEFVEALSDVKAYREFSNSFLVFANLAGKADISLYPRRVHFPGSRAPKYRISTEIYADRVLKKARSEVFCQHISRILENEMKLVEQYGRQHVAKSWRIDDYTMATEYVPGDSFNELCQRAWHESGKEGLYGYLDFFCRYILRGGTDGKIDIGGAGRCYNIDLNFDNIVVNEGNFVFIDYEWLSGGVTSEFVLWRSLALFYSHLNTGMQDMLSDVDLCGRFGITDDMMNKFKTKEAEFMSEVCDMYMKKYEKEVRLVNIAL